MKPLDKRIELIKYLGFLFRGINSDKNDEFKQQSIALERIIPKVIESNQWFTRESIYRVIKIWGETLIEENIDLWTSSYKQCLAEIPSKKVLVIMAGNIPLVGFHDFFCTILTGHQFMGKLSSRDNILFPLIKEWIIEYDPYWRDYIHLSTNPYSHIDAVIATGSNNTSKFIEQKYSGIPKIIRHNRNSLAILSGGESEQELASLSNDILWYYGLGCRNISMLFIPKDYELNNIIKVLADCNTEIPDAYNNNLRYQRAKAAMNKQELIDAKNILLFENPNLNSPLACVHLRRYRKPNEIYSFIEENKENIQCIVGNNELHKDVINFGESQLPPLDEYADDIDTVDFLTKL